MNEGDFKNSKFTSHDGTSLTLYEWPVNKPKAYIHIVHGMSDYAARYNDFANWLNEKDYYVYSSDLRGHGKTAGEIAKVGFFSFENGWEKVVKDLECIYAKYHQDRPLLPHVILGHSMGSLLARSLAINYHNVGNAYIFSATSGHPGFKGVGGEPLAKSLGLIYGKKTRSKLLNSLTYADFNKRIKKRKTSKDWLSKDTEIVEAYVNDPYCMQIFTNQFFADLAHGVLLVNNVERMKKMNKKTPILLMSGTDDPVGNYGKGVEEVFQKMKSVGIEDIKMHLFDGGRHEMLNEINRDEVYLFIDNWIKSKNLS